MTSELPRTTTSGTVVFRQVEGVLKIALAHDPSAGPEALVLPKGHVRDGETLEMTAIRETREEVGVQQLRLVHYLGCVTRRSVEDWGEVVLKDIHLYLAYAVGTSVLTPSQLETTIGSDWFTLQEALPRIKWEEERSFLKERFAALLGEAHAEVRPPESGSEPDHQSGRQRKGS